jgi:hypothetical protein
MKISFQQSPGILTGMWTKITSGQGHCNRRTQSTGDQGHVGRRVKGDAFKTNSCTTRYDLLRLRGRAPLTWILQTTITLLNPMMANTINYITKAIPHGYLLQQLKQMLRFSTKPPSQCPSKSVSLHGHHQPQIICP